MRRGPAVKLALAIGLAVLALIVLLPFWWVMSSSIKATNEIVSYQPTMVPHSFTLEHFEKLLGESDFPRFLFNSVIVSSASMGITVALAVLSGYAFFRLRFPGREFLYRAILLAYAFPGIVVLVPLYGMMSAAGLIDNPLALVIVNVTFAVPFAIWMMRAFLAAVPIEIEEAARLDGAIAPDHSEAHRPAVDRAGRGQRRHLRLRFELDRISLRLGAHPERRA